MAKTAAQLVPLKTQLSGSMSIFRFADATTDFSGSVAYQGFLYDNAGCSLPANGTTGVQATAGTVVPATPLAIPGVPVLTNNQNGVATISTGLNRYQTQQYYYVAFFDSSFKDSQGMVVLANIPGPTTTGSVTFTFAWPAGAAGAAIYKPYNSNGFYMAVVPNTVASYTDNTSYSSTFNGATGVTIFAGSTYLNGQTAYNRARYPGPQPDGSSTAPTISATSCVVTTSTTGGSFRASGYTYGLSAFNTLGETTLSAETAIANITGVPVITGASAGVMNNITTAQSTASGNLPVGKYYYKVTAFTQNPVGTNAVSNNGFSNYNNGYGVLGASAGYTESLPSAEVNITTTGVGNVTLSWSLVTNATGYVIYRSRDLPPPVQSAATTSTSGGTLPATTAYYYVVTATNNLGETIASNEVTITTGAGSTNSIGLSWANVPHAYGYKVYRGTSAAGENALLTTIANGATITYTDTGTAGSAVTPPVTNTATGANQEVIINQAGSGATSFIDSGLAAYPPSQNSGFQPPTVYQGNYTTATVQASWSAVTGATGYNLYRNLPGTVGNQVNMAYFNVSGVTVTDSGNQTGTKYSPQFNWSGSNNITMVGRYLQTPSNSPYVDKMGFTVSLVPGQQYRFGVYSQTNQTQIYNSGYFTATTSALQYYEMNPNINLASYSSNYSFFYIQGQLTTSTIAWGPNAKSGLVDNPTISILSENNTWAGYFNANNYGQMNSSNQLGQPSRDGNVPTQVYNETASNLPMRINFRSPYSGTSINGTRGTMLGGPRVPQYAYSANVTYATPIKSLVPNWSVLAPPTVGNSVLFANRWVTVEVSTDGGTTWATLTNQTRYIFPTAATQLQYRYTVPQNSMAMSFDRRLMTGLPATDNTPIASGSYNYYYTPDTSQVTGYYYQVQNRGDDIYMYSNGNLLIGNVYANYQYNFWSIQGFSADVDLSMTCYFNQGGNIGLRFRNDGSGNSYGGYYAYIDNAGNWGLNRTTYGNSATTLASGSGATNGLLNQAHVLRVIAVGSHIQFFVDGLRVLDYTATDTGNYLTGQNIGLSGARGVAQGFQATALSTPSLANSPQWELEYVSAYLET